MTQGKEWKHLLLFALPLMGGQALQQLYNTVDGIIVGNYVGDIALGAVGACSPLTMLFVSLAVGMCTGCSVVAAQYFGAGKREEMRRAASTSILLLIALGAVLSVLGAVFARPLLGRVLGVSDWYIEYAVDYFSIYAVGLVFQFAYNVFAALLRAVGDSKSTLYFLIVSSVTNLTLDLLFVLGFHWEVAGAAIATVISQGVSAVVAAVYMARKYELLRFSRKELRFYGQSARLTMRIAAPSTLQQTVMACGNLALQRILNDYGGVYPGLMSGATSAMRIEQFAYIPLFAFNTAMATYTGQNVGAGQWERVKTGRRHCLVMAVAVSALVSGLILVFRAPLINLFGVSPEGLRYGVMYLTILCPGLPIFGLYLINGGVLTGAGDTAYNAFVLLSSFALRCVLAYTLAYCTPLEYRAVWISMPIGWVCNLILSWARYYTGGWKRKAITGK
jgi:putative MATE family efflux protein